MDEDVDEIVACATPWQWLAVGACALMVLLGIGGCFYLQDLGTAKVNEAKSHQEK